MKKLLTFAVVLAAALFARAAERPNIVFVLTDDQGYGDLACHGNPVLRTPNIDKLHSQSVRFTNFHVSPSCAPTRAALLTGRHNFRGGVTATIYERERLRLDATTFAQVLKSAGYATGIFGKWHLGDEDDYQPDRRGFDEVFIHGGGGIGQTFPGSCGDAPGNTYFDPAIKHNGRFVKTRGYCTDVFFDQALRWIEERKGKTPFYAHIATNAPHAPLQVPEAYEKMYAEQVNPDLAKFFGMITNIDDNVGKLMAKLAEWEIERNTLLIFMTDNGSYTGWEFFNAGMRGRKASPWEGGFRVPSFWRWPGVLEPGERDQLTAHLDFFPTLAELAGAQVPDDVAAKLEGRSLVPLLKSADAAWPDRLLFVHRGQWKPGKAAESKYRNCAVRNSRYKLVAEDKEGRKNWQLFDLQTDPGETTDVLARQPGIARDLEAAYDAWWESVQPDFVNENAVGPAVNPFKEQYARQFPNP